VWTSGRSRYHFGSKRELFEAARAEAFRRFVDEARRLVFEHDTVRGRLQGWVEAYRRLHALDTDVLRFLGFAIADGVTEPDRQVSLVEAAGELFGMLVEAPSLRRSSSPWTSSGLPPNPARRGAARPR
jgi:AcrR family transcriptional regulator